MSVPGSAALEPRRETSITSATARISGINDQLRTLNGRMSEFRNRTMGQIDPPEEVTEQPEPVRADVENLGHFITMLDNLVGEAHRQFVEIETL